MRLHQAMASHGHSSQMIALDSRSGIDGVVPTKTRSAASRIKRLAARAFSRLATRRRYFFQVQSLSMLDGTDIEQGVIVFKPDLIVAHYISAFLSFTDLARLQRATGAKIAFNLLDMAAMTGGCHYAWDCDGFRRGCGGCPALYAPGPADLSARIAKEKRGALAKLDHVVIAASSALHDEAAQSWLFEGSPLRTILIGLDPRNFTFPDRQAIRASLGLPSGKRVIMFGAQSLSEERKGMREMVAALGALSEQVHVDDRPCLLVVGEAAGLAGLSDCGFEMIAMGRVDHALLSQCYHAADLFVCPSTEDSGPMMINEAMMAGTPVISFRMGVAPDLIVDRRTGIIASHKTPESLAAAISEALDFSDEQLSKMRVECRTLAEARCSLEAQISAWAAVASA